MIDKYGNLTIIKGATLDVTVTFYQPDGITPIDLTDKGAITRIKESLNADDSTALILSTANGKMELGGTAGTIRWMMDKTETIDIIINEGIMDVFLIDGTVEDPFLFHKKFYALERV